MGNGDNAAINPSQLADVLDSVKLQQAAASLRLNLDGLLSMLATVITQMLDKGSCGASLLDSFGGSEAISGMVKSLFD